MKLLLILFLNILPSFLFAQKHYLGIKGGINRTNILAKDIFNESKFKTGFAGGISYNYHGVNRLTLTKCDLIFGANLYYTQKGFNFEKTSTNGSLITYYNKYNYVSLPIELGLDYNILSRITLFANIGLSPSILINAKSNLAIIDPWVSTNTIAFVSKFDFAALVNFGVDFKINEKFIMLSSIEYQKSFTSISNQYYYEAENLMNYGFIWSIGIKYCFADHEIQQSSLNNTKM